MPFMCGCMWSWTIYMIARILFALVLSAVLAQFRLSEQEEQQQQIAIAIACICDNKSQTLKHKQ